MKLSDVDLRLLRIFVAVADAGGFAAAEDGLNVSASTISIHMKTLEMRVGARLCRRGRSGFALTDEGLRMYRSALELFGAIDRFGSDMQSLRGEVSVMLRIGMSEGLADDRRQVVSRAINLFEQQVRSSEVVLTTGHPNELQADLSARRIDAAIIGFPSDLPQLRHKSTRLEVLYEARMLLCCGRGHPLFDLPDGQIRLAEVQRHPIVARTNWTRTFLRRFNIRSPRAIAQSFEGVSTLVTSGRYLGYLTEAAARLGESRGELRVLDLPSLRRRTAVCFALNAESEQNPVVRRFRTCLSEVSRDVPEQREAHAAVGRRRAAIR